MGEVQIPDAMLDAARKEINEQIKQAVKLGFKTFATSLENGANLLFIDSILEYIQRRPAINLEIYLPYSHEAEQEITRERVYEILSQTIHMRAEFGGLDFNEAVQERNRLMFERAKRIVLLFEQDEKLSLCRDAFIPEDDKEMVKILLG